MQAESVQAVSVLAPTAVPARASVTGAPPTVDHTASLLERYRAVRQATMWLASPLSPEDAVVQSMPDASPAKWHLGHTTWFFETFILECNVPGYCPDSPHTRVLFNSYYNAVGEQHPRARRGMLTRPSLDEIRLYRAAVDQAMERLIDNGIDDATAAVIEIGLHHEQQHQELLLMDIKHTFWCNPLRPAYRSVQPAPPVTPTALSWLGHEGGLVEIGHEGQGFAFDNEGPRHQVFLRPFEIGSRLITCGEYLAFIEDKGYARPELWLSEGWAQVQSDEWNAPLYWERTDAGYTLMTLSGMRDIRLDEPVCHLSYYEADAYATWADARLPTEAEWEVAAARISVSDKTTSQPRFPGNWMESERLHPAPAADAQATQFFGDVWEWTSSPYVAYPGFKAPQGALGEYNGKFMCSQLVLRGGCCATSGSHIRPTYRNFFYPHQQWMFSGLRLARDLD